MAEPDEGEIAATVAAMTDEDLVAVLSGEDNWYTTGREAAGVPSLKLTDGPTGARGDWTEEIPSAAFPAGVALGATWDEALGDEARQKRADVLLGPTINLQRSPLSGRGFECLSEDPLLTARLGAAIVRGVQSRSVAACPKHLVCND